MFRIYHRLKNFSSLKTKCFNPKNYRTYKMSRKGIYCCLTLFSKNHTLNVVHHLMKKGANQ